MPSRPPSYHQDPAEPSAATNESGDSHRGRNRYSSRNGAQGRRRSPISAAERRRSISGDRSIDNRGYHRNQQSSLHVDSSGRSSSQRRRRSLNRRGSRSRSPRRSRSCEHRQTERRKHHNHDYEHHRPQIPPRKRRRRHSSASQSSPPPVRSRKPLPPQEESYRGKDGMNSTTDGPEKEQPNYRPTGLLAAETNTITIGNGSRQQQIVLKYHEPPEARKPPDSDKWMMYIFKGEAKDPLKEFPLFERSCWLLGREMAIADVSIENPSCSKQHAVLQFRYVSKQDRSGERKGRVKLYVLDLESANGTMLNGERIDPARYVELRSKDVLRFGESTRDYVILRPTDK